jgi:hypothetical protein
MVLVATLTNFLYLPLLTVDTVTIMAMAVVYLAVTLGMFLRPALRQMDLPAPDDRTHPKPSSSSYS